MGETGDTIGKSGAESAAATAEPQKLEVGDVALSLNGRDKGYLFFVVYGDGGYVGLADGRRRMLESPKRKKAKHLKLVARVDSGAAESLRVGGRVTNAQLRKSLTDYAESAEEVISAWPKKI